jgi:hypothetical protein
MFERQMLPSVIPSLTGAMHDRSFESLKLCRLAGLGGMVPRGLDGDRSCVGDHVQGGGDV